jgi:hypothetical protein
MECREVLRSQQIAIRSALERHCLVYGIVRFRKANMRSQVDQYRQAAMKTSPFQSYVEGL